MSFYLSLLTNSKEKGRGYELLRCLAATKIPKGSPETKLLAEKHNINEDTMGGYRRIGWLYRLLNYERPWPSEAHRSQRETWLALTNQHYLNAAKAFDKYNKRGVFPLEGVIKDIRDTLIHAAETGAKAGAITEFLADIYEDETERPAEHRRKDDSIYMQAKMRTAVIEGDLKLREATHNLVRAYEESYEVDYEELERKIYNLAKKRDGLSGPAITERAAIEYVQVYEQHQKELEAVKE